MPGKPSKMAPLLPMNRFDAHFQRALQLATALLVEFFRCLRFIVYHGQLSLAEPQEGINVYPVDLA